MSAPKRGWYEPCAQCAKPVYKTACYGASGKKPKKYCSRACQRVAQCGSADPVEAFWLKVDKNGAGGCWLYTGFRKWDGYGWLARWTPERRRWLTAHRYAWILTHGEPAKGMHILHKCDNPPCCNPDHLFLGTHQDNMKDKVAKGRSLGHARLYPERIRPRRAA